MNAGSLGRKSYALHGCHRLSFTFLRVCVCVCVCVHKTSYVKDDMYPVYPVLTSYPRDPVIFANTYTISAYSHIYDTVIIPPLAHS